MDRRCELALCKAHLDLMNDLNVAPVADHLRANQTLNPEDYDKILAKQTEHERRRCLLGLLPSKGPGAFEEFSESLAKDQPWLHDTLQEKLSEITEDVLADTVKSLHVPGTDNDLRCQLALSKTLQDLVKDLSVEATTDYLYSTLVLSREDVLKVLAGQSDYDRRRYLLDVLPNRGPRALDELCLFLADRQPWLHEKIQRSLAEIEPGELETTRASSSWGPSPTSQRLQEVLRESLLEYVDNDPSKILPGSETGVYLTQEITAHKWKDEQTSRLDATDVFELLQTCSQGQRLFVYGSAGMGKSSLCRQVVKAWAGGDRRLTDKFAYVYPIPLRLVRSRSLIDIICDDAQLVPRLFKDRVREEIALNPGKVLIILDSYEEFTYDAETEELNRLIRRALHEDLKFQEKTVVLVTSRPHSEVKDLEQKVSPRISAHLHELSKKLVDEYVETYPNLSESAKITIRRRFGFNFLKCPINLWLFCYVMATMPATDGAIQGLPSSQTVLLNVIVQHILLAYLKKKHLKGFQVSNGSPLTIRGLPGEVKLMLKEAGRLCYIAVRQNLHLMKVTGDIVSIGELLALGLFAEGSDDNTVVLPHQLFKEYLTALYLSSEEETRDSLLRQIEDKSLLRETDSGQLPSSGKVEPFSKSSAGAVHQKKRGFFRRLRRGGPSTTVQRGSTRPAKSFRRPCLVDLLRSQGIDNVLRFLVGLVPSTACQLTNLFVIRQSNVTLTINHAGSGQQWQNRGGLDYMHSFLQYELSLLQECSDENIQKDIAKSLLGADIFVDSNCNEYEPTHESHRLLDFFSARESNTFLEKFYNCQSREMDDGRILLTQSNRGHFFLLDSFVAGFILLYNCYVSMEKVWLRHVHLPAHIVAQNMDVGRLVLTFSTLYKDSAECVASLCLRDRSIAHGSQSEQMVTAYPRSIHLDVVRGLGHLFARHTLMSESLRLSSFGVDLPEVSQAFPAAVHLELLYFCYDNQFLSNGAEWSSVRQLSLHRCDNIDTENIFKTFTGLWGLDVVFMTVLISKEQPISQTLHVLKLHSAHVKRHNISLSQEEAQQVLSEMCPHAELVVRNYMDQKEAVLVDKGNKVLTEARKSTIC